MRILLCILFYGVSICLGQTTVYDNFIDVPTLWTADGSPYILTQDFEIGPNAILYLEAGVEVRFYQGHHLTVRGRLEAIGTDGNPVRFGPLYVDNSIGWEGILLDGKKASLHLQFADVLLAETGLHLKECGRDSILIEDCTFGYGGIGLDMEVAPSIFIASRNAWVQNEVGLVFNVGGTFKGFRSNEICTNSQYQAIMRTREEVRLASNCWCDLETQNQTQTGAKGNGILDRRTEAGLGWLNITPEPLNSACNIVNPTSAYIKGGGDVTVVLDDYVSTQNDDLYKRTIRLYPHPMSSTTTIDLSEAWRGALELSIYDVQGRLLWAKTYAETKRIEINRTQLPTAGIYMLHLRDDKGHFVSTRLVVQ